MRRGTGDARGYEVEGSRVVLPFRVPMPANPAPEPTARRCVCRGRAAAQRDTLART